MGASVLPRRVMLHMTALNNMLAVCWRKADLTVCHRICLLPADQSQQLASSPATDTIQSCQGESNNPTQAPELPKQ